jgi:hypothetical protein
VASYWLLDWDQEAEPTDIHELVFWVYTSVAIRGGEIGFVYDESVVESLAISRGVGLPEDGRLDIDESPELTRCRDDDIVGLTGARSISYTYSEDGNSSFEAGWHELLRVSWEPTAGAAHGAAVPFKFVECLTGQQAPDYPVRNRVTIASGLTRNVVTHDAEGTINVDRSFRRGDVNDDELFDSSDVILILTCAFLGVGCSDCADASDVNDDGEVDVADAIYMINWRFADGAPPPAPFPECGSDPSPDDLGECMPGSCAP